MACLEVCNEGKFKEDEEGTTNTLDGSVDMHGRPAIRAKSGRWVAGIIILRAGIIVTIIATLLTEAQRKWRYQPNIATFGADQFDEEDRREGHSKVAFFSYFYLAMNLGSLFSNTILGYFEDEGIWAIGFWASTASAFAALVLFLIGTPRYRHFKPNGNPLARFCQVLVAAVKKARFLDRAAYISSRDLDNQKQGLHNPWRLCPITQVEEVKCILRLLPIWLCTILYSVVFTQMATLFVEQGAAMKTTVSNFRIPPASMSSFDILSVAVFIFFYRPNS
ncbi:hypothetical protein J5N97_002025 [Dioscorea zingiberensis]|uniref:Uncharacterized protein n=1 Tax=Dioscorea zingiberensis TaxID=325984 RepID=A0A9D5BSZ1_9LILI|nr:hypothetical protein J5N97_002025 [Dioscorea zingiberensis]